MTGPSGSLTTLQTAVLFVLLISLQDGRPLNRYRLGNADATRGRHLTGRVGGRRWSRLDPGRQLSVGIGSAGGGRVGFDVDRASAGDEPQTDPGPPTWTCFGTPLRRRMTRDLIVVSPCIRMRRNRSPIDSTSTKRLNGNLVPH